MRVLNNGCALLQIFLQLLRSGFLGGVLEFVGGLAAMRGFGARLLWGDRGLKPPENWKVVIPHLNIQISYRKYARAI